MKKRKKRIAGPLIAGILSFLLAGAGLLIAFIRLEVYPFGDNTVLIVDSIHQYLPFYTDLSRALHNGDSLFYSLNGGLGYDRWTVIAYYMANPFNLILRFIPIENTCDFMDWAIWAKSALCGGVMGWYLKKKDPIGNLPLQAVFGSAYGLSSFIVGYGFNIMWLDTIAALPVVAYGIEKLVRERKGLLYCLSLAWSVWCCYYTGWMTCIFSVIYFIAIEFSTEEKNAKGRLKDAALFAICSLLGGGMCGIMIIPAWKGLSSSQSIQGNSFPDGIKFYMTLEEMLERHAARLIPVNVADSQAGLNVYCGVITVPGFILYLADRKRKLSERIAAGAVISFLLLSFTTNVLNYIWHGFHIQNGIPNRFAFIYIFLLLGAAYKGVSNARDIPVWKIILTFAACALFLLHRTFQDGSEEITETSCAVSCLLLAVYCVLIVFYGRGRFSLRHSWGIPLILSAVYAAELITSAVYGECEGGGNVSRNFYLDDASSFEKMVKSMDDQSLFRAEIDRQHMRDAAMFAGMKSTVIFNSTMPSSVTDFLGAMGAEARTNKTGYYGYTRLLNDLMGVKYVASPQRKANTFYGMPLAASYGPLDLFENDDVLSLAYVVNDSLKDWKIDENVSPFENQNAFVKAATDFDQDLFRKEETISLEDGVEYTVRAEEGYQTYLWIESDVAKLTIDTPEYSKTVNNYNAFPWPVNAVSGKTETTFSVQLKSWQQNGSVTASIWRCSDSDYSAVVNALKEQQAYSIRWSKNAEFLCSADIVDNGSLLLITIPYSEGWSITVDGQNASDDISVIGGCLTGIRLSEGTHEISMKYHVPGLRTGMALSLVSAALLFYLECLRAARGDSGKSIKTVNTENLKAGEKDKC